jgi:hypothetical protein
MQANRRPLAGTMHKLAREEQYKADTFTYQGNPEKKSFFVALSRLLGCRRFNVFFYFKPLCQSGVVLGGALPECRLVVNYASSS